MPPHALSVSDAQQRFSTKFGESFGQHFPLLESAHTSFALQHLLPQHDSFSLQHPPLHSLSVEFIQHVSPTKFGTLLGQHFPFDAFAHTSPSPQHSLPHSLSEGHGVGVMVTVKVGSASTHSFLELHVCPSSQHCFPHLNLPGEQSCGGRHLPSKHISPEGHSESFTHFPKTLGFPT